MRALSGSMSRTVNSTSSLTVARDSKGVRQYTWEGMSQLWSVAGSRSWTEFPTRIQIVKGLILLSRRACFEGMQTRSSLHMGTISTEWVYLNVAVLLCVSDDSSCSDVFVLEK